MTKVTTHQSQFFLCPAKRRLLHRKFLMSCSSIKYLTMLLIYQLFKKFSILDSSLEILISVEYRYLFGSTEFKIDDLSIRKQATVIVHSLQINKNDTKFIIKSSWFSYQIFSFRDRLFRLTKKTECYEKIHWIEETLMIFPRRTISNFISKIVFSFRQ